MTGPAGVDVRMDGEPAVDPRWGGRILHAVSRADRAVPLALLIRHSAREAITDMRTALDVPLTPEGEVAAREFGRRLPAGRTVRLRHSPVHRCEITALRIAEGVADAGGVAALDGPSDDLGGPYVLDPSRIALLAEDLAGDFARAWFAGELPADVIRSTADAARDQVGFVARVLGAATVPDLHVLITHDWNVLAIREALMGLRTGRIGWVDYLDGLLVGPVAGGVEVSCHLPGGVSRAVVAAP
jgi:broad specificity phosphatase PhoE